MKDFQKNSLSISGPVIEIAIFENYRVERQIMRLRAMIKLDHQISSVESKVDILADELSDQLLVIKRSHGSTEPTSCNPLAMLEPFLII